ncbi:MAG: urease accessory protein UreD [Burkholderiales bacterium]
MPWWIRSHARFSLTASQERRHVELAFERDGAGKTFLSRQFVRYPFHVCRGLYDCALDSRACSVTLQSTSGGLFESDDTRARIVAGSAAHVQVTTAAATVVHSMKQGEARQVVELEAGPNSVLEYSPQSLILFPGSALRSTVSIVAHSTATVIVCDSFLTHDPSAQQRVFAQLDMRVNVSTLDGDLLARDRQLLTGQAWRSGVVGIAGRYRAHASIWLIRPGVNAAVLGRVRNALDPHSAYGGASLLPNDAGLSVRLLCLDAVDLHRTLNRVLAQLRECDEQPRCWRSAELKSGATQPESMASA